MSTRPNQPAKADVKSPQVVTFRTQTRVMIYALVGVCFVAACTAIIVLVDRQPSRSSGLTDLDTVRSAHAAIPIPASASPSQVQEPSKPDPAPLSPPPGPAPEGMVWIPAGSFLMGAEDESMPDAIPVHKVTLSGFWMDRTEVTNKQFRRFVNETGYVTTAEKKPDPKDFPGAPAELLVPGSIVFTPPAGRVSFDNPLVWWRYVPGANWKHPEGPDSSIDNKDDHPVVQVCWNDAVAYARWAKKRLPTEAEWEYAARGGNVHHRYFWGDELTPGGQWRANVWQGSFPDTNSARDGFTRLAPVGTFPPNAFGLVDMAGNVWEWCSDWYQPAYPSEASTIDPAGPLDSHDPQEPGVPKRVQRGGSFLCSDEYCTRYLPGSRGKGEPSSGASHLGFRCVLSVK